MPQATAVNLMPPGTVLGPIGDKVILDNEKVRVWTVDLEAGGRQPWHRHDLPYLIVPLTDGSVKIQFADGAVRTGEDKVGQVRWRDAGEVHELYKHRQRALLLSLGRDQRQF